MRSNLVLLLALVVTGLLPATGHAQNRKKSFFERAAELIAPRPARAQAAPVAVAPAAVAPNPANAACAAERKERLESHIAATAAWIDQVCSLTDDQKKQLADVGAGAVKRAQDTWNARQNRNWQNGDRDFIPFEFVQPSRAMTSNNRFQNAVEDILNDDQNKTLKLAMKKRADLVHDELVGLALVVLDQELFLSPAQRTPVAEELDRMFGPKLYPGLFSFYNNSWPFQRAQFLRRSGLKKALGDKRYARYERLTKQNGQADQHVMISMNNGDGETAFRKAIEAQPARLAEAMAVRIQFMAETEDLTEAQQRKLTLAAKGAATRVIDKWVESSEKQMQQMRERFVNQNVSWGMSLPQVSQVERQKLWTVNRERVSNPPPPAKEITTEPTLSPEDEQKKEARALLANVVSQFMPRKRTTAAPKPRVITEREKFQRKATIDYLVAMIDQEVWLRDDQREKMHSLVDKSVTDFSRYSQYSNYYLELQLLADAVHGPQDGAVQAILDQQQLKAWNALKKQFKVQNNNMIKLTYRYGEVQFPFISARNRRR